jgi:acyl carrier protein
MADDTSLPGELAALLTKILFEEVDPNKIEASLNDEYGANSMDMVDIVESIEREYGVKIANDQIPTIGTFGDLLKLIRTNS